MQLAGNKKPPLSDLGKAPWAESQRVPEPCLKGPFSEQRVSLKIYSDSPPKCKTPPNARANPRVRAINIIRCLEVSSLGFKF